LALKDAQYKVALLDKKTFPRDKVCGDVIPGRAIKTLRSISPEFGDAFRQFEQKFTTTTTKVYYGKHSIQLNWVGESYTCARIHFDNFLLDLVKERTGTNVFENTGIGKVEVTDEWVQLTDGKTGQVFKAKIVVGADGAHSIIAKQLANRTLDRNHYVGSVRAYYSNVSGAVNNNTDVYLDKRFFPSYLWVFPLPGNKVNVGFGMLSSEIAKRKLNIKNAFQEFINETPALLERFKGASLIGELEGFGLPLGSNRVTVSGERFILTGDAASLVDPVSGDGIGNAMFSGKLAAEQVIKCFKKQDFSKQFISGYDKQLYKIIGPELRLRFRVQQLIPKVPVLVDLFFSLAKNKRLLKLLQKKI
jgi:geranylgeranyl reductase family protein